MVDRKKTHQSAMKIEICTKMKIAKKQQDAKLTSFFGGSLPPHFGGGSFAPNKDLIRFPFIMLTHSHHFGFVAQIITKLPFSPQTKAICSCAVIVGQGQVEEWGQGSLTFENKEPAHTKITAAAAAHFR